MELVGYEDDEARSPSSFSSWVVHNLESSLKELKQTKKDLEAQIRQNNLAELDRVIAEKGFTFEQVMEMLNGGKDK